MIKGIMPMHSIIVENIVCATCCKELKFLFQKRGFSINQNFDEYHINLSVDEVIHCEFCQRKIENYTILSVLDEGLEQLGDFLSNGIEGCERCEGQNRTEMEWIGRIESDGRLHDSNLKNYLCDNNIPQKFHFIFVGLVNCEKCGSGRGAELDNNSKTITFSLDTLIYTRESIRDYWGLDYIDFGDTSRFLANYNMELHSFSFFGFKEFLMDYPMLAIKHFVGEMIYKALEEHFATAQYIYLAEGISPLYRGRARKSDSAKIYTPDEMWAPPPGLPQHGRFNPIGISVLYLTDHAEAIPYEIHASQDEQIDIVEFQVVKPLKLFDMQQFSSEFEGFFTESNVDSKILKEDYLLPNFIGNCCQHIGYDGVKYTGVQRQSELNYTNYALFAKSKDHVHMEPVQTYDVNVKLTLQLPPSDMIYDIE